MNAELWYIRRGSMFMYVYVSMYFDLSGGDRIGHDMNCHQNICVTGNEEEN